MTLSSSVRRVLLCLSLVVLCGCTASTVHPSTGSGTLLQYADSAGGVQLEYPATWTKQVTEEGLVMFIAPDAKGNVSIAVQGGADPSITLEQYTAQYEQLVAEETKAQGLTFASLESTADTLGGLPAHHLVFTLTADKQAKGQTVWTLNNGKVYTLTYSTLATDYESMLQNFLAIKNSVKIK